MFPRRKRGLADAHCALRVRVVPTGPTVQTDPSVSENADEVAYAGGIRHTFKEHKDTKMADKLKTVTPSLNQGRDFRPGPGTIAGPISGSDVPAGPWPTPAPNSGTKLGSSFPTAISNDLRSGKQ